MEKGEVLDHNKTPAVQNELITAFLHAVCVARGVENWDKISSMLIVFIFYKYSFRIMKALNTSYRCSLRFEAV